ncbi:MAG: bifunctional diaminohydroxyphosphoribosylaminopyrimidine deaminase/5-amino-6-(5-phosphoribosylamino)uracil reductase RibD [bacterium]
MDREYMNQVFKLADQGKGRTSPNPMVGAIIVKDNEIVGQGYHERYGAPHAEIRALEQAREKAKGATLYINLEPCCHQGQTPPCTAEIIRAGIQRVVVATKDPNPLVNGQGIRELKMQGIEVKTGVLENAARKFNEYFFKYIRMKTPFVILKMGMSLDGKMATKTGDSRWITSSLLRGFVHQLRNEIDATLVGIGTVIRDNPRLTTRLKDGQGRDPKRIIVDSLLRIPLKARIFTQQSEAENIIVTTTNAPVQRVKELEKTGARIIFGKTMGKNMVDLKDMVVKLGQLQITSIMIEGGAGINGSAIQAGIVDKVIMFIAPKIIGGVRAPSTIGGDGVARVDDAIKLNDIKTKRFGNDLMIEGYVEKAPSACIWSPFGCGE